MSKTSKTGLTGSRKKAQRELVADDVDWRDAMHEHCRRLNTLVELLEACGHPLEPEAVESIGGSVRQELEGMKALLAQREGGR